MNQPYSRYHAYDLMGEEQKQLRYTIGASGVYFAKRKNLEYFRSRQAGRIVDWEG